MRNYMFLVALAVGMLTLGSCRKKEKEITADDAADAVTYAMEASSGGTAEMLKDCAVEADNTVSALGCGGTFDTTVVYSHSGTVTANYSFNRSYTVACTAGIPSSFACVGDFSGSFDASRMSSSNSGTNNWTLTGVTGSSNWIFNGSVSHNGTHTSKVRNKYTFTTTLNISLSNVQVSKTTYEIVSGSGSVSVSCTVDGNTYDFTGSVTYNGDGTATLVIDGNTYSITLY